VATTTTKSAHSTAGDRAIEHRISSLVRWNAVAIVLRANKESSATISPSRTSSVTSLRIWL
jgi:pyruvate dehydrogenase complex dehydrogenase (E1) component